MDVAAAAAVNVLATSATRRITNPTNIIPRHLSNRKDFLVGLYAACSSTRNNALFLTHCSTKPDVSSNNATSKDPTVETDSKSETPQLSTSPPAQIPLYSSSAGLVFDLGPKSSWDSKEVGSPVVKRFISDEEERWYMWYHGRSDGSSDSIGLAVSSNGVHWERGTGPVRSSADVGLVMNCSKDWWAFDTESIKPSEVVIMSSTKVRASSAVYWLYYTGFNSEKIEFSVTSKLSVENLNSVHNDSGAEKRTSSAFRSLPGLAISQDGRHWARIEGEHHSGALFDVGIGTEWDSLFIAAPQVVFHSSGDLRMYYHSFDSDCGQFGIGIARSRDGIRWVKLGKIIGGGSSGSFDEYGVMNAHVVRNRKDGGYMMAYEGVAEHGQRSIGLAISPDGLKDWRRCGDEATLKPSAEEDGWDNSRVGTPCLVQMDGDVDEWRLYYRGIGKVGRTGIGMAVSEGSGIRNFQRWRAFHL